MTKKMTITLEEELINSLNHFAKSKGQKKTQVIREALQHHLNIESQASKKEAWERENREAIDAYNDDIAKNGVWSEDIRLF